MASKKKHPWWTRITVHADTTPSQSQESPESYTGLWLLGDRDDSRDRWIGVACVVFSQGLSLDVLEVLALPRR